MRGEDSREVGTLEDLIERARAKPESVKWRHEVVLVDQFRAAASQDSHDPDRRRFAKVADGVAVGQVRVSARGSNVAASSAKATARKSYVQKPMIPTSPTGLRDGTPRLANTILVVGPTQT